MWWIIQSYLPGTSNDLKVAQKPFPHGWNSIAGPYATQAQAQAALKASQGGGGGGGTPNPTGGQWWVISVPTSAHGSPKGEVSQKPFPTGSTVVSGPYATRAEAVKAMNAGPVGHTGLPNPLNLFHGLDLGSILLRIGEVLLGIVLIGVGLARVTGVENAVSSAVKNMKVIPV